jgi:hypothetical protein
MAAYKTHRAIRTSRRVSSETGVAITAVQPPRRATYRERIEAIREILRQAPPVEWRLMLAELARKSRSAWNRKRGRSKR